MNAGLTRGLASVEGSPPNAADARLNMPGAASDASPTVAMKSRRSNEAQQPHRWE